MKKVILVIASVLTLGMLMTSCGQTKECPAYGQVETGVNASEVVLA